MYAVVKTARGAGGTELREVAVPEPQKNQVRIKMLAAGVCSSDIAMFKTDMGKHRFKPPVVLGHEGVGVIDKVGPDISELEAGMLVTAETTQSICGVCEFCNRAQYNMCSSRLGLGSSYDGFFAEYLVARYESLHVLPEHNTPESFALLEPLSCVTHMVIEQSTINPGDKAIVFGPGPLGILASQVLMRCGADVILVGTTNSKPRLEIAKKLGVKHTINSNSEDVYTAAMEYFEGTGADCAYMCTGSNQAFTDAARILKKRGQLIIGAGSEKEMPIFSRDIFFRELNIRGALSSTPKSWEIAMSLVRQNKIELTPLITHRIPLAEWEHAYELVASGKGCKVLLIP